MYRFFIRTFNLLRFLESIKCLYQILQAEGYSYLLLSEVIDIELLRIWNCLYRISQTYRISWRKYLGYLISELQKYCNISYIRILRFVNFNYDFLLIYISKINNINKIRKLFMILLSHYYKKKERKIVTFKSIQL